MDQSFVRMKLGALFDWDGVVIDSSKAHEESWDLLGDEVGKPLPEGHFKKGFGRKNQVIIPEILGWTEDAEEIERLGDRKEELYREIVAEKGVERIPGIEAFLERLNAAGIGCAVGSSTPRKNVETILEMEGFGHFFHPDDGNIRERFRDFFIDAFFLRGVNVHQRNVLLRRAVERARRKDSVKECCPTADVNVANT